MTEREYDVVVFGATGFTGALTAEYLAGVTGAGRWAIAGRSREKLQAVRERLSRDVPVIVADVGDPASLRAMAESTRVVITTVGPYIHYGEPVVAACAAAGTHYVDLTGEPEFVDLMWLRHHEQAERTGAKLVHSCGFDSIPYDLGALYTVNALPEDVPIKLEGFVRVGGTFSGGTLHSAVHIMARLRQGRQVAAQRKRLEAHSDGRRVRGHHRAAPPRRHCRWLAHPRSTIDPVTVLRSARALDRYGPDFSYGHYIVAKRLPVAAGLVAGVGGVVALAQLPPTRNLLLKLKDPGDGPEPGGAREGVFHGALPRRGRRPAHRHRGHRRRSGLRRDVQDAGAVRAVPRPRRSAPARRAAHARRGDGSDAHRPPRRRRHHLCHGLRRSGGVTDLHDRPELGERRHMADLRTDGRAALDWAADYLERVGDLPVLAQVAPGDIRSRLPAQAPDDPEPFSAVLRDLDEILLPGVTHWQHPRFFAYFATSAAEPGILAELLAATLNSVGFLWRTAPASTELEGVVLDWTARLLGLPDGWHGHIEDTASTGTMAAMVAARQTTGRNEVVCSEHTHSAVEKGARMLGMDLRKVATDDRVPPARRRAGRSRATPRWWWPPSAPRPAPRSIRCRRSPTPAPPRARGCTSTAPMPAAP